MDKCDSTGVLNLHKRVPNRICAVPLKDWDQRKAGFRRGLFPTRFEGIRDAPTPERAELERVPNY